MHVLWVNMPLDIQVLFSYFEITSITVCFVCLGRMETTVCVYTFSYNAMETVV